MADRTRRGQKRVASYYDGAPEQEHPLTLLGRRVKVINDCWVVDGDTDRYPELSHRGRSERANRYIWRHTHDVQRIRPGVHIHHTCEVKGCINPNHLVALDQADHRTVHAGTVRLEDVVLSPADVEGSKGAKGSAPLR